MPGIEEPFRAEVTALDGTATVRMHGELDLYAASAFRDTALALLRAGHSRIVLDASALTFIDSTGIGVIVGAMRRAEADGGFVQMTGAINRVARVLEISGLAPRLGVAAGNGQAAASG